MPDQVGPPLSRAGSAAPAAAPGPSGLERFANRATNAGISFLTQTPQIELDRQALQNSQIEQQTNTMAANTEAQRIQSDQQLRLQELSRIAFDSGGGPEADAALNEIFALDPVRGDQLFDGLGAKGTAGREEAARDAAAIQALPFEQRRAAILERAARIEAQGRDASETLSLLDMDEESQTNQLRTVQAAALTAAQRRTNDPNQQPTPAGQVEFESLIADFSEEDKVIARRINAGLDPRAGTSVAERRANNPNLNQTIEDQAASQAEAVKFGTLTGDARATRIDEGLTTIEKIDANIRNLDSALVALDGGAKTGSIIDRFTPTIREQSVALQQVQAQLGLDVVQSVQFGALSEGELQLALATALPTNLDEPALRDWITTRQAAQTKLRGYFEEQIEFLDTGGTPAGFLRMKRRQDRENTSDVGGFTVVEVKD